MIHKSLVELGKRRFAQPESQTVHFLEDIEANAFLNDLAKFPHAYVLACLMDRQIKAEKAWVIPVRIRDIIGSFALSDLLKVSQKEYQRIFQRERLHRFNDVMANIFHAAVHRIENQYAGNASGIWNGKPSSSVVVYRFLEFEGGGIKIATMAANILARQFRIPFADYYSIDISPDVHIRRVMMRMGLVPKEATNDMIIYKARELNPEFPGIIDFSCWEIGRTWCKPKVPDCVNCLVKKDCQRVGV